MGPAGRLDAVLVCGGQWHDFDLARRELLGMLGDRPQVRTRVYEDYARVEALERADLLVTYTCNVRPAPAEQDALVAFLARGGRWLALHGSNSAIDAKDESGLFRTPRELGEVAVALGSQFLAHPPIAAHRIEIAEPEHPLVRGVEPFEVRDELYVSELHGPLEVLLHTRFTGPCRGFAEGDSGLLAADGSPGDPDGESRPVLYLKGNVCYFTLGHCRGRFDVQDLGVDDLGREDRGSWDVPEFRTVLERCLSWAVTGEMPAQD